ncbi:unnamed protein product [Prunus brigantina]
MIGSIPVNLYPAYYVLMTSTSETSKECQKDNSVENAKVQWAKPPSSPKAHDVESTSQEVYPCSFKVSKPQDQSRTYMGPLTCSKSRDMIGMIISELSALNSTHLDDYLLWNPLYDDPVLQTQENDGIVSQGTKLHEGVESMQVMMTGTSNNED